MREWGKKLMTEYLDEARETLKEENSTREFFYIFRIEDKYYGAANMEGDNIIPSNLNRELNRKHREILKECTEGTIELEDIYNIKA